MDESLTIAVRSNGCSVLVIPRHVDVPVPDIDFMLANGFDDRPADRWWFVCGKLLVRPDVVKSSVSGNPSGTTTVLAFPRVIRSGGVSALDSLLGAHGTSLRRHCRRMIVAGTANGTHFHQEAVPVDLSDLQSTVQRLQTSISLHAQRPLHLENPFCRPTDLIVP